MGGAEIMRINLYKFVNDNKWIIFAAAFFILWKFFLVYTLWEGRSQPPEWNDAYGYINHIHSVSSCPSLLFCPDTQFPFSTYAGFDHLTYRLFWGGLAHLLHVDAMTIFHWSFYLGIPMLVGALLFFLRRLTENKFLIALSVFVLAFYNGSGSYHGFFWVAPSFFVVVFFFLLLGILLDRKTDWQRWAPWIFLLVPSAIFTHVISLYSILFLLPLFVALYSLFWRKVDKLMIKKAGFAVLVALAFYLPVSRYVSHDVPYGPQAVADQVKTAAPIPKETSAFAKITIYDDVKLIEILPGIERFYLDYIHWVFRNLPLGLLFIAVLLLLIAKKEYTVLSLYAATLIFTILSTVNEFGFRALVLLWPVTFLLYAYGAWAAFQTIPSFFRKPRILGKILPVGALAGFVLLNATYSVYWNETQNRAKNFHIPDEAIEFIYSTGPDNTIALDLLIVEYLKFKRYAGISPVKSLSEADYLCVIELDDEPRQLSRPAAVFQQLFTSGAQTESNATNTGEVPKNFVVADTFSNTVCYRNTERK
jgi:hypothetical protein